METTTDSGGTLFTRKLKGRKLTRLVGGGSITFARAAEFIQWEEIQKQNLVVLWMSLDNNETKIVDIPDGKRIAKQECQCERDCHFDGSSHKYNEKYTVVVEVKTPLATMKVCQHCAKTCMSIYRRVS